MASKQLKSIWVESIRDKTNDLFEEVLHGCEADVSMLRELENWLFKNFFLNSPLYGINHRVLPAFDPPLSYLHIN